MGRRLALLCLIALAGLLVPAPARAGAGDSLISSDPPDGAALASAPATVTLTFGTSPVPSLSHIAVATADGIAVGAGEVTGADRSALRLPVSIHRAGDYTIGYHAVLRDGAEQTGVLRFSVGTGLPPATTAAAVPTHQHSVDPVSAVLLLADLAVLVTVLLLLRRPAGPARPGHEDDRPVRAASHG
jgi:copper resistance protein C